MSKKLLLITVPVTVAIVVLGVLGVLIARRDDAQRNVDYFPLSPKSSWTYRVISKSQHAEYIVIDQVVGVKYIAGLKLTGVVVDELYNLDRGGTRPIVYYAKDGYMTRISGLDYDHGTILTPAWGRSEDANFLPSHLLAGTSWTTEGLPFGHLVGGFTLAQVHHSIQELAEITVPAGNFRRCIRIETRTEYRNGPYARSPKNLALAYTDWYAPNVGLIKTFAREDSPGGAEVERVELTRFKMGPISRQR